MAETAREFAEKMWEHTAKSLLSAEEWMEESASLVAARDAELVKAAEEAALRRAAAQVNVEEDKDLLLVEDILTLIPEGGHLERAISRARLEISEHVEQLATVNEDEDHFKSLVLDIIDGLAANRAAAVE